MNGLRERQAAAARNDMLETAMTLLEQGQQISHEAIAAAAAMSARTVYRYFPDRASLLQALWTRLRDTMDVRLPTRQEEILPVAQRTFGHFDRHAALVKAVLRSEAGTEVRNRGGEEGRPAFAASLEPLLRHMPDRKKRCAVAAFVSIYSAPFWELLRDRGGLDPDETQQAVGWVLQVLLDRLEAERGLSHNDGPM